MERTLASFIPVSFVLGLSNTRKAAKLAVYEATMIIAKPAHTIPKTLAEKLRGVPKNNFIVIPSRNKLSDWNTFSYTAVEENSPSEPNGAGEV